MLKLDSLRATILAAIPRLRHDPRQLIVMTGDDGRIISTGTDSLSYEMEYTALVWVLGLSMATGEHPDAVILPALAWHKLQQPELYQDPGKRTDAFRFFAQPLDDEQAIDLHLRLKMTERVLVRTDPATGHIHANHAPEPAPLGFATTPEKWTLDIRHPDGTRQHIATFDGPALPRARQYLDALGIPRA